MEEEQKDSKSRENWSKAKEYSGKIGKGTWEAGKGTARGIGSIFTFFFNEHSISYGKGGMLIGAIAGLAFGILTSGITNIPFGLNLIYGIVGGIIVGGILGIIFGSVPKGAATTSFILIMVLAIYFGFASGLFTKISGEYGGSISAGTESLWSSITCFFSPECIKKTFYEGWDTDTKREDIDFEVKILTSSLYQNKEDNEIKVRINVKNPVENGVEEFEIEPECLIDEKNTDVDYTGLTFIKSDSEQFSQFECIVPSSMIQDKESIKANVVLTRPAKSSVSWTAKILEKESITGYLPVQDSGSKTKYATLPYSFEIGVSKSLPLSEDDDGVKLEIRLIKDSELKGEIEEITKLEVYGGGETAYINSCEGFKKVNDKFILEEKETAQKEFECELRIDPSGSDETESVVFMADIEYILKIETIRVIPIIE